MVARSGGRAEFCASGGGSETGYGHSALVPAHAIAVARKSGKWRRMGLTSNLLHPMRHACVMQLLETYSIDQQLGPDRSKPGGSKRRERARVARRYDGEKRVSFGPSGQHIPHEASSNTLAEAYFRTLDADLIPSGQGDRAALIQMDADITAACHGQRQGAGLRSGLRERLQGDVPFALIVHGDLPSFPQHTRTFRHELIE